MARKASKTKRFLERIEEALTASALAEEGESEAARAVGEERSGPTAVAARAAARSAGSASAPAVPHPGR